MNNQIRKILITGKTEDCTVKDEEKMVELFHQPNKEFEVKEELLQDLMSETLLSNSNLSEFETLFSNIWRKIEQNKKQYNKSYLNNIFKLAAAIVIGLIIGTYVNFQSKSNTEPVYYAAHAPKGSVSEMILPDGSIIFLNADSKIKYSIDGKDGIREVFLEGEAWFDVQKNEDKPFLVRTPFYNVNVTGTKFNVKAYESDNLITTTLEEGKIILQSIDKFKLAENITMYPGEQAILKKDSKEFTIKEVNTKWFTSWKDNKLIFVNMNLKDLVVLLERKYGVDIEVKNKEILDLHFDGTIKNESIMEFLEIIQNTLPIHYKIVGQKIEITNES